MAYTPKDNTGTLFRNDRREKETHPNAKGTALIDGVEYWVSAWTKSGDKGNFQSLAFQRKEKRDTVTAHNGEEYDRKDVQSHARESQSFHADLDEDLPF